MYVQTYCMRSAVQYGGKTEREGGISRMGIANSIPLAPPRCSRQAPYVSHSITVAACPPANMQRRVCLSLLMEGGGEDDLTRRRFVESMQWRRILRYGFNATLCMASAHSGQYCISRPFETIQISASDITRAPFGLLHCTRSCRIIITVIWSKFVNRTVWYRTISTRYYPSG
jgi:hypothetical protein